MAKKFIVPKFPNSEEELSLIEIMKTKKVISITFPYLSEKRKVKSRFPGFSKEIQDKKLLTIRDENGITILYYEGKTTLDITFSNTAEFEKIYKGKNYDPNSLWAKYVENMPKPYFIGRIPLKKVKLGWVEK